LHRRQRKAEQCAGRFDHLVLTGRAVVREVVDARRAAIDARQHAADDVVDMDPAEDLAGQVDAVRLARHHPIERRAAGAIDAGQAEGADLGVKGGPVTVGSGARGAAARADRCAFVDPGAAGVAINSGRGKVADPFGAAGGDRAAIARKHRIPIGLGRHRGQDVARAADRGEHRVIARELGTADRFDDEFPGLQGGGDVRCCITGTEDQKPRHGLVLAAASIVCHQRED